MIVKWGTQNYNWFDLEGIRRAKNQKRTNNQSIFNWMQEMQAIDSTKTKRNNVHKIMYKIKLARDK